MAGVLPALDLRDPWIVGFGVTGQAVAEVLLDRGHTPSVIDDSPGPAATARAEALGIRLVAAPDRPTLESVLGAATVLLPSPGVPDHHPVFAIAAGLGVPVRSEFDLARLWDDRPIVAITGTNGKTTVTTIVTDALNRSGRRAIDVGNTPTPLVAALGDDAIDVFVVEASSFRLGHSATFSPAVAAWLNFSPDHLDAHASLEAYERAKASIWSQLGPDAVVVANAEDDIVMRHVPVGCPTVTFGQERGDWHWEGELLVGPDGPLLEASRLQRRQPHDRMNAASVAATAFAAGATSDGIVEALVAFEGLPHRLQMVGRWDGVTWYDDSKATVPQATLAAITGFDSVVLIAGGRNKGLSLEELATAVPPVRALVATGDAADELAQVFADAPIEIRRATSMGQAIDHARDLAGPGDAVLLSPACTSFDWYANYNARGDHFTELVLERFSS